MTPCVRCKGEGLERHGEPSPCLCCGGTGAMPEADQIVALRLMVHGARAVIRGHEARLRDLEAECEQLRREAVRSDVSRVF